MFAFIRKWAWIASAKQWKKNIMLKLDPRDTYRRKAGGTLQLQGAAG